jgi:hypothetical protein
VATFGRSAGVKKSGWKFHVPVCSAIAAGVILVVAVEIASSTGHLQGALRDLGLVLGGALIGFIGLCLYEIYRAGPRLALAERERDAERQRHQDERRLDFEQYRALQLELRQMRSHASSLQAKLDLTGAIDRDRIGDALVLGFYFHRRNERLPSSPAQSIFNIAARRLKLLGNNAEIKVDKDPLYEVLHMAYGPIVAEAFDLGYTLSHLGEDGFSEVRPEILADLENQLKALRLDHKTGSTADLPDGVATLFKQLADRVVSIVRQRR